MKVLGLIPARGGSKGVPRKNVKLLGGKPLLAYTAESGLAAKSLTKIVLTTDDEEIASVGRACGLEVPFMRPAELAADTTPTLPVIMHVIEFLEAKGERFDAICLLQPTNPFRRAEDIDACIRELDESGADSVISVLPVPHEYNPNWVYFRDADGGMILATGAQEPISRRQDLPAAYHRDGSVYVTRRAVFDSHRNLYGDIVHAYEMNPLFSVNIDTMRDWETAERMLEKGRS